MFPENSYNITIPYSSETIVWPDLYALIDEIIKVRFLALYHIGLGLSLKRFYQFSWF